MPHVSFEELARLQLPENQLEARTYGLEKKSVCRNCGIITSMLGHHVPYCPVKPQTARDYDRDNGGTLRSCVDCGNSFLAADPGKWASCKELCERCVKLRRSASGKASWSGEKAAARTIKARARMTARWKSDERTALLVKIGKGQKAALVNDPDIRQRQRDRLNSNPQHKKKLRQGCIDFWAGVKEAQETLSAIGRGRPRKDTQRRRVQELRGIGLEWPQVKEVMNTEFNESSSVRSYQDLLRNRPK